MFREARGKMPLILTVFCENRLYLCAIKFADLAGKGINLICTSFDDKGNDVDPLFPDWNALPSKNQIRVF
jgi:hypothetical protein